MDCKKYLVFVDYPEESAAFCYEETNNAEEAELLAKQIAEETGRVTEILTRDQFLGLGAVN